MAGKAPRKSSKRDARARVRSVAGGRAPLEHASQTKSPPPKARSTAMRLAAEVDALRADLAAAKARVAELETRVDEDPLTGLLNRRGFERALERALAFVRRYSASAALLYLDLDRLKPINDRHGHAAGDWVLGRIGRLIAGQVRASDVTGRIGGDEFALLLWHVDLGRAEEKARLLETLIDGESFVYQGERLVLGLSAGAVTLSAEDTVASALARADGAMYARKRERRTSV